MVIEIELVGGVMDGTRYGVEVVPTTLRIIEGPDAYPSYTTEEQPSEALALKSVDYVRAEEPRPDGVWVYLHPSLKIT